MAAEGSGAPRPVGPASIRRVLVPLDGSAHGEQALPYALAIARRAAATVEVVHAHDPHEASWAGPPAAAERLRSGERRARAYLEGVVGRLEPARGVRFEETLLEGRVVPSLLARAREAPADLIVLTTHGLGPLSRMWFGSVADELIHSASVPLLVTRPQEDAPELLADPALRRILVPLDGSELAEQILPPALALGALMDAEYRLLRVVRPAREPGRDPFFSPPEEVSDVEAEARARAYLSAVKARLGAQSSRVGVLVDSAASAAQAIIDIGNPRSFDLIALSTRGRGGLSRALLGSVADKVVRGASVPVLVHAPCAPA